MPLPFSLSLRLTAQVCKSSPPRGGRHLILLLGLSCGRGGAVRNLGCGLAIAVALVCGGCSSKPVVDGRKIFLQSEAELHKVRSFRAHIVTGEDGGMVTDAQFQCDKNIAHYLETKDNPPSKTEFIATDTLLFHRSADALDVMWNAEHRAANLRACTRLLDGPDRKKMGVRYLGADHAAGQRSGGRSFQRNLEGRGQSVDDSCAYRVDRDDRSAAHEVCGR